MTCTPMSLVNAEASEARCTTSEVQHPLTAYASEMDSAVEFAIACMFALV